MRTRIDITGKEEIRQLEEFYEKTMNDAECMLCGNAIPAGHELNKFAVLGQPMQFPNREENEKYAIDLHVFCKSCGTAFNDWMRKRREQRENGTT